MERMERQSTHVLWHFSCLLWWFLAAWTSYFVSQGKLWTKGVRNSGCLVWTPEVHQGLLHKALAVLHFLLKLLFLKSIHSAGSLLMIFLFLLLNTKPGYCCGWMLNKMIPLGLISSIWWWNVSLIEVPSTPTWKLNKTHILKPTLKLRYMPRAVLLAPVLQCRLNYLALLFDTLLCSKGLCTRVRWGKGASSFTNQYKVIDKAPKTSERQFINRKVRWANDLFWWTSSTE